MRVLLVSTSDRTGGAAVAATRLCDALNNHGVKAKMLVRDKQSQSITVVPLRHHWWQRWHFLFERMMIFARLHFQRKHLFDIDTGGSGADITRLPEFREADVIHLHWVCQGMLSLGSIRKILRSGKPVVWTMHDAWPATALCHLTLGCRRFVTSCQQCKYLPGGGSAHDLAARVWSRKQRMLGDGSIHFVACSRWLEGETKASGLLRGQLVTSIPNAIDTRVFCPGNKLEARRKEGLPEEGHLLLFVCQRATNRYKGMDYLREACQQLARQQPELAATTTLVILGSHAEEVTEGLPFRTVAVGYVTDEQRMVDIYRAADVFVLPSLSENLPNTIMEAMACGVPCVGFRVGGIPEEIDHLKNGYVAAYRDAADLAAGIGWVLSHPDASRLSAEAVRKVAHTYSQASVALHYSELYQQAIAQKHFRL